MEQRAGVDCIGPAFLRVPCECRALGCPRPPFAYPIIPQWGGCARRWSTPGPQRSRRQGLALAPLDHHLILHSPRVSVLLILRLLCFRVLQKVSRLFCSTWLGPSAPYSRQSGVMWCTESPESASLSFGNTLSTSQCFGHCG